MQSLAIVRPLPVASVNNAAMARLLTPNPKEAVAMGDTTAVFDFGSVVTIDSVFLGYHTATAGQQWQVVACDAQGRNGETLIPTINLQAPGYGPPHHGFYKAAPVSSRYFRLDTNTGPQARGFTAGCIAFGRAWQAEWGTEYGAGRTLEDTGVVERLPGGGFGIDEGVAFGGYEWTFGDLGPEEIRSLYDLMRRIKNTRTALVIEDPEQSDGLNERLHWGLFSKFEKYERTDPKNWRWSLSISDWA